MTHVERWDDHDGPGYDDDEPLSEDGWYMHQCKCPCGHIFEVEWHKDIVDCGVREKCPQCGNIYDEDDLTFIERSKGLDEDLRQMGEEITSLYEDDTTWCTNCRAWISLGDEKRYEDKILCAKCHSVIATRYPLESLEKQDEEGKVEGMNPQEQKLCIRVKHLETALRILIDKITESALLSCSDDTASDTHNFIADACNMAEKVLKNKVK